MGIKIKLQIKALMTHRKISYLIGGKQNKGTSVFDIANRQNFLMVETKGTGYELYHDKSRNQRVQLYRVKTPSIALEDTLEIYQWRFQTEMPVVKTCFVQIRSRQADRVHLDVFNEHIQMKLQNLYELPFHQVVYLMKQSAVGFQRLFNKFGSFQVSPNMLSINEKGQCKVWYNQNSCSNMMRPSNISQHDFIKHLLQIFSERTLITNQAKYFFKSAIHQCQTFIQLLKFIEKFMRIYRIKVATKFSLNFDNSTRQTASRSSAHAVKHLRQTFSNRLMSLNNSIEKSTLISSLEAARKNHCKNSDVVCSQTIIDLNSSANEIYGLRQGNSQLVTSIISPSNMKGSNNTTNAQTHFEGAKVSNQFSRQDMGQDYRRTHLYTFDQKFRSLDGLNFSSEIQQPAKYLNYRRNYSIDRIAGQTRRARFPVQKSLQNIVTDSPSSPKTIEIQQYREPEGEIQEQVMQEDENSRLSASNSHSNSNQRIDKVKSDLKVMRKHFDSQEDAQQLSKVNTTDIIQRNGWKTNLGGILNCSTPMKQSVQIGKEVNLQNDRHNFQYLKTPNLQIYQSFIPNDEHFMHR